MIGIWFTGDNDDAHSGNLAIVTYTCIFTEICAKHTYLRRLRLIFPVPFRPRPRSFFALVRSKQQEQTTMGYNYQVTFSSSVTREGQRSWFDWSGKYGKNWIRYTATIAIFKHLLTAKPKEKIRRKTDKKKQSLELQRTRISLHIQTKRDKKVPNEVRREGEWQS